MKHSPGTSAPDPHRRRITVISVVVAIIGALVVIRLFLLQIVDSASYKARAERQYVTPTGAIFDRGNIYFTAKDGTTVAAATIENGFKLAINPTLLEDPERTYELLSPIVPLDRDTFLASAEKNVPYQEVAGRISEDDAAKIAALKLAGVTLYRDKWRFYPGGTLASRDIGFVSYRNNSLVGNYGLENYYNDVLARRGDNLYVNFFAEIFANIQSTLFRNAKSTGDVVTSIEPTVQAQLEDTIASVKDKWSSETTGGVVMDPYTGEILAMAAVPTFDANNFGAVKDIGVYTNPLVQSDFEMGSIVKPLVMSGAIEAGAVTPDTTYVDRGSVKVRDRTIYNFDKAGRGPGTTMQRVLNESLNTGMVFVEQKMGHAALKQTILDRFKLGTKTGVDMPGEVNGLVSNLNGANDVNYATAAFGQGIATTPLNIVRGYAALANGGYLVTPHLAVAIDSQDGTVEKLEYPKGTSPILSQKTLDTMTPMLEHVVEDGYHRGLAHYTVAAKTGTAQIAKPSGGGYYADKHLHSLIGFFPASHPRFVLYLFNYDPKNIKFAAQTLADPFFNLVQFLTNYYQVPPDR